MAHTRLAAAAGSALFFLAAPGVVAGLVPWLITGWRLPAGRSALWIVLGAVIATLGAAVLVSAFVQFVAEGRGTPAPVAPTEALVIGGLYRFVRNPMYLAVGALLLGQTLVFGSIGLAVWTATFAVMVFAFVVGYEQPVLMKRYGAQYAEYRDNVRGWWPRLTPWRPS